MAGRFGGMVKSVLPGQAKTDLLGAQQRRSLWFAGVAAEWRFFPKLVCSGSI